MTAPLSPDEHEFHYNPQRAFPDFARRQQARESVNARAQAWPGRLVDLAYGDGPLQTIDVYPAPAAAGDMLPGLHLFFHGGYWRQQDKSNFAFIGAALAGLGLTTVVANYDLCPAVTLDGVVDSALACFDWVCRHGSEIGGDPTRISLSGHSAGAHLVAEILATDWPARGIDPAVVTGATLISGIFDPAPAIRTTVNAELHLDKAIAARHDVERRPVIIDCPASIVVGGREPARWIEQSFRYFEHLRRQGRDPAVHVLPGRDHFDIIDEYLDQNGLLTRDLLAMATDWRQSKPTLSAAAYPCTNTPG